MVKLQAISSTAVNRRSFWVDEIVKVSGNFGQDSSRIEAELSDEINRDKAIGLLDHLHLCGAIPEHYGHDSSEEKLYSKYTDALLASVLRYIGLSSTVLTERADAADVIATAENYSLVGDAKVFRLSRTAKNQKDFKIDALHSWKGDKTHAVVVCPIYQLPTRASQIYQQAIARDVCIFTYSHLAVLVRLANETTPKIAEKLFSKVLKCVGVLTPSKDAIAYWSCINQTMLEGHKKIKDLWQIEKLATVESIALAKREALQFLKNQRIEILSMTRDEAISCLLEGRNIEGKQKIIKAISDTGILSIK